MLRKAVQKNSQQEVKDAGDYCIFDLSHKNDGIMFICPHEGCGDKTHLPLLPLSRGWHYNDTTKTLTPSIKRMDPARCEHHFSLTEGVWIP